MRGYLHYISGTCASALTGLVFAGALDFLKSWEWWGVMINPANLFLALSAVIAIAGLVSFGRERMRLRVSRFDMPMQEALDHIVGTDPHSFDSPQKAERHFFRLLHRDMCTGDLPVVGREGEFGTPKHIRARKCRKLKPTEVVSSVKPASPSGVRFSLVDDQPTEFTALRIRSRDLYKIWPI